jgi:hypothetical protein
MEIRKLATAGTLILTLGTFAPPVFAQVAGMPAGNMPESPAAGQPGTEAPASAAPIGAGESAYMSHEQAQHASNGPTSLSAKTREEEQANRMEVSLERQIVAARARGADVAAAQHQKWLGSIALRKGNRSEALRDFTKAQHDLSNVRLSNNSAQNNHLRAKETDQTPNAVNMHPNKSATTAY